MSANGKKKEAKDYFELYKQYTTNLRHWFVIYGIGGVVLFISHADFFSKITAFHKIRVSSALFIGVFVQIIVTYVNKYINWHIFNGIENEEYKKNKKYIRAIKWSNRIWLDLWADRISILAFIWATIELIVAIIRSS